MLHSSEFQIRTDCDHPECSGRPHVVCPLCDEWISLNSVMTLESARKVAEKHIADTHDQMSTDDILSWMRRQVDWSDWLWVLPMMKRHKIIWGVPTGPVRAMVKGLL